MGYEVHFNVSLPLKDGFKRTWRSNIEKTQLDKEQEVLISLCMNLAKCIVFDIKDKMVFHYKLEAIYDTLQQGMRTYGLLLQEEWKQDIEARVKDDNGDVWFCGWEYSRDEYPQYETLDEVIEFSLHNVFGLISTVPLPDYFNDRDRYYEFRKEIAEYIEYIPEAIYSNLNHKFIREYDDQKVNYDDEDDEEVDHYTSDELTTETKDTKPTESLPL